MISAVTFLAGFALIWVTAQDAFEVMLLPRSVQRRVRIVRYYYRLTWAAWGSLARRISDPRRRQHFLGFYGALSMIALCIVWAGGLISGFALIMHSLSTSPFGESLYASGTTFFTLGDTTPKPGAMRFITIVEAGLGLGFIAAVIGYLPVLYQVFARREAHVLLLDGRAGTPPTAVGLFIRHPGDEGLSQLSHLLAEWEVWSSELLESHLTYPMLAFYRSQHHDQSWLAGLAAIMDTCALILIGIRGISPLQARMTFVMARQVLVEIAGSTGLRPSRYNGGDRLGNGGFDQLAQALATAGLHLDDCDARLLLHALRATYEPLVDALATYFMLTTPDWVPKAISNDRWAAGPRGTLTRRLLEELQQPLDENRKARPDSVSAWRRIRGRLEETNSHLDSRR